MQFFYDAQVRRYITQTIRVLSNFTVKYGDGTLHQVPVMYGDPDRQVASIIRQGSENVVNTVPRIAVYVTGLEMDKDRLADSTYVGKLHFRERGVDANGDYTDGPGRNYTVERLMPTPFKLKLKVDIWSSSTDQKLQILEQILVLFNPSLELQTTDNYVDWTSLSVLNLGEITWSSRSVPVGNDTPIDIASISLDTPIWISPPAKVKHLGVITKIITNLYASDSVYAPGYIDGLGIDPAFQAGGTATSFSQLVSKQVTTIGGYKIAVYAGQAYLLEKGDSTLPFEPTIEIPEIVGPTLEWSQLFDQYPGQYVAGSSMIYLLQPTGTYIVGTVAVNPIDSKILTVNWDTDSLVSNTGIDSSGYLDTDVTHYNSAASNRPMSPGTFDAIVNPATFTPTTPAVGTRYLIIEDVTYIPSAVAHIWGTLNAVANDIIEWNGTQWRVIFNSTQESDTMVWQTNIYTGVQYLWNGVSWVKSFEGEYTADLWKIVL